MLKEKLEFLKQFSFDDIYNVFVGFDEKKQKSTLIILGIIFVFLFLIPPYIFSLRSDIYEKDYLNYNKEASKFFGKVTEYTALKSEISKIQTQNVNMSSLKVLIEKIAKDHGIGTNIQGLPESKSSVGEFFQETRVDARMSQVPLDKFLAFLQGIETFKEAPLKILKVNMRVDSRNRALLRTVSFSVSLLSPKKAAVNNLKRMTR